MLPCGTQLPCCEEAKANEVERLQERGERGEVMRKREEGGRGVRERERDTAVQAIPAEAPDIMS